MRCYREMGCRHAGGSCKRTDPLTARYRHINWHCAPDAAKLNAFVKAIQLGMLTNTT